MEGRNKANNARCCLCPCGIVPFVYKPSRRCVRCSFFFGATVEFSDRESSPDPSCSNGSSVEFVVEAPGLDWEDDILTIVLSDNEEGPPKPKKKTLTKHFTPTPRSTLPFGRIVPRSQPTSSAAISARNTYTEKLSNVSSSL